MVSVRKIFKSLADKDREIYGHKAKRPAISLDFDGVITPYIHIESDKCFKFSSYVDSIVPTKMVEFLEKLSNQFTIYIVTARYCNESVRSVIQNLDSRVHFARGIITDIPVMEKLKVAKALGAPVHIDDHAFIQKDYNSEQKEVKAFPLHVPKWTKADMEQGKPAPIQLKETWELINYLEVYPDLDINTIEDLID